MGRPETRPPAAALTFCASLALLGWLSGHALAYRMLEAWGTSPMLHDHAHGYMTWAGVFAQAALVCALIATIAQLVRTRRPLGAWLHEGGSLGPRRQAVLAATLPAGAFFVGEVAERWLTGHALFPGWTLLAVGMVLQVATGLLALAATRKLLRFVEHVTLGATTRTRRWARTPLRLRRPDLIFVPRAAALAGPPPGRAPPSA